MTNLRSQEVSKQVIDAILLRFFFVVFFLKHISTSNIFCPWVTYKTGLGPNPSPPAPTGINKKTPMNFNDS